MIARESVTDRTAAMLWNWTAHSPLEYSVARIVENRSAEFEINLTLSAKWTREKFCLSTPEGGHQLDHPDPDQETAARVAS